MLVRDKHSGLLDPFVIYGEYEVLWIRSQKLNFQNDNWKNENGFNGWLNKIEKNQQTQSPSKEPF
jgi:hypothetical protein